jgi:hypothetical protein
MSGNKPWKVMSCLTEKLEETLNQMESENYVVDKYEMIPESFFWIVVGHLVSE